MLAATQALPSMAVADEGQPLPFRASQSAELTPTRSTTQPVNPSTDAQWIEVRKRKIGEGGTVLRWQTPPVAASTAASEPVPQAAARPVAKLARAWEDRPASEPVPQAAARPEPTQVANKILVWGETPKSQPSSSTRLVAHQSAVDPFNDPFGDQKPEFSGPARRTFTSQNDAQLDPGLSEQPEMLTPPTPPDFDPFRDDMPQPTPYRRPAPEFAPESEPAPIPDTSPQPAPFQDDLAPAPPSDLDRGFGVPRFGPNGQSNSAADCDKIYNERNCCEEGERCKHARLYVRENTIDKISLNISPSFKPDASSPDEAEQARALRLAQSAIRSWRNRDGEVIARGQVTDLQFGRVYIEQDGQTEKIPVKELSDDDWCFLAAWWGVPTECSLGGDEYSQRDWLASTMTWKASGLCHKPLYFEEVQHERYGHTAGPFLQPVLSGAHFFLNIAALPYKMGINPPNECQYALGYYRPGNCAPWLLPPIPLSIRGGLMQAGVITGGIFVIP